MKNCVFQLPEKDVESKAAFHFRKACGFDEMVSDSGEMMAQAERVLAEGKAALRPAAVVSVYPGTVIEGNTALLDGIPFRCTAFSRMDEGLLDWIYVYILTIGEISCGSDSILDQFYADLWGTAYTDASIEVLCEILREDGEKRSKTSLAMNPSFGPGFYGMDAAVTADFFRILDGESIGVIVTKNSFMIPQKSCAGFFMAVKDSSLLPPSDCVNCKGVVDNCVFCRNYKKIN